MARRRAMERLTGTLFAPAITDDFEWTAAAFRDALPESSRDQLPEDFDAQVDFHLKEILADEYDSSLDQLKQASLNDRTNTWYSIYDAMEVEPPPSRQLMWPFRLQQASVHPPPEPLKARADPSARCSRLSSLLTFGAPVALPPQ